VTIRPALAPSAIKYLRIVLYLAFADDLLGQLRSVTHESEHRRSKLELRAYALALPESADA
jgi:hypothetical protein